MNRLSNEKRKRIAAPLFFLVIFAAFWCLTSLTPLIADDFNYAFTWADEGIGRIDNFYLVYTSMESHRMWTHGRVFAQGWVTLFMMWPKWIFNLANAAVLTLMFGAVWHFFQRHGMKRPILAAASTAMLFWICMPVFGQVFLWLDGACNYSWGAALGFALIELTQSFRRSRFRVLSLVLLLPFSFAVGAWSEHLSFAVLIILFLLLLSEWIREKRAPLWEILILLVCGAGYLFLMLAPSMLPSILKNRAKEAAGGHLQTLLALLERFWWIVPILLVMCLILTYVLRRIHGRRERLAALSGLAFWVISAAALASGLVELYKEGFFGLLSSTPFGFLLLLACFFAGLRRALKCHADAGLILDAVILASGGLGALFLFAFAMYFPARSFCAPVIYIGIATSLLWFKTGLRHSRLSLCGVALVFLLFAAAGLPDIWRVHEASLARDADIRRAIAGDGILYTSPYPVKTKYSAQYGLLDLAPGESWPNDYVKEYYRLQDIVVIPLDTEQ